MLSFVTYVQSVGYGPEAVYVGLAFLVGQSVMLVTSVVNVDTRSFSVAVAVVGLGDTVVEVSVSVTV